MTVLRVPGDTCEMASYEKKMIPLEAMSQVREDFQEQPSPKELVDVKFPSRPRRRVVVIAGVTAVLIVVIVAASLVGKYVPDYLSDANSNCKSVISYWALFYRYFSVIIVDLYGGPEGGAAG